MKRPVTFLCLADLHYRNVNIPRIDKLGEDLRGFIDEDRVGDNKKWAPDYLLIAGDIIDWTKPEDRIDNHAKYEKAREGIDGLIKKLDINKDHVIMIPGNHDNTIPGDVSPDTLGDNLKVFDNFCKNSDCKNTKALDDAFGPFFEDYIDFAKTYYYASPKNRPEYTADFKKDCFDNDDNDLEFISGVKVFENDHLCFVLVNTEWLYTSDGPFSRYMKDEHYSNVKKYLKLYERCRLCPPFVKDAFELIQKYYKDYTIVTLMHRGFDDLRETGDKYVTDSEEIDAIDLIKNKSHIILTGHDHTPHLESPTLINNKVQNYRLGSVGRKDPLTGYYTHTATLIRVDRSQNLTEVLQMRYHKDYDCWIRAKDAETFVLDSKYKRQFKKGKKHDALKIVAKSNSEDDVEKAIKDYFGYDDSGNINLQIIKDKNINGIEVDSEKTSLIVVWHDCVIQQVFLKESDKENCSDGHDNIRKAIEQFKDKHKLDILKGEISIVEVDIDYPTYYKI